MADAALEQFQDTLLELLDQCPDGISEYELFNRLSALNYSDYHDTARRTSLGLFRAHFALFHALYGLRDRLWGARRAHLEIGALCILLAPYQGQTSAVPSRPDPLREYYLDLSHLQDATAADVEQLLGRFWRRFGTGEPRAQALGVLGLNDPVDDVAIKQAYRRLAMQHHPDRGGNEQRLQEINAAVTSLLG